MIFKWNCLGCLALLFGTVGVAADVPELAGLVLDAGEYELIYRFDPRTFASRGYSVDRSKELPGLLTRVGYLLKVTAQDGKSSFVFTSMQPFSENLDLVGVPKKTSPVFQTQVKDLEVLSDIEGVKNGRFEKGNVEFWPFNYGPVNSARVPGADGKLCDFGDQPFTGGDYGSMQVHNFQEKQTVFSFSCFKAGANCDLGIGNAPQGQPDWTFARNGGKYLAAECFVVGKIDRNGTVKSAELDLNQADIRGESDKDAVAYHTGDDLVFTLNFQYTGKGTAPAGKYFIRWIRSGDDGKKRNGKVDITEGAVVIRDRFEKQGFIRVYADLVDENDTPVKNAAGRKVFFDGGAGADIGTLQSSPEPSDFDQFWARQKEKLAQVPVKYSMKKVETASTSDVNVYSVRIDCPGPRPVTGYLSIPADAKEKSYHAQASFQGYTVDPKNYQQPPKKSPKDRIFFVVNAHGYDLGKDEDYAKSFFDSIASNGHSYAFDPIQNRDPETAYFNGMVLRVLRALEFLKQLPEYNGKMLVVDGGSQGGLQSIWAAGLDQDVTHCFPLIPWCCDLAGAKKMGRLCGDWRLAYVPALDYYDAANHAKRIHCPVTIARAGLGDYVCPPSGVTAMYNNLKGPKKIVYFQGSEHGYVPRNPETFVVESK